MHASDRDTVLPGLGSPACEHKPSNYPTGKKEDWIEKLTIFFSRETLTAVMASGSGDSVTRRSVASQFFTQEEGPGVDGMTTSERVSITEGLGVRESDSYLGMMLPRQQSSRLWGLAWASETGRDTCLSLLPGGRSSEPGSADHQ